MYCTTYIKLDDIEIAVSKIFNRNRLKYAIPKKRSTKRKSERGKETGNGEKDIPDVIYAKEWHK